MTSRQQRLIGRLTVAFAILLAAALALENTNQAAEDEEIWIPALGSFENSDVIGIEITGDQVAMEIRRESETWMIQDSPPVLGDTRKIGNLLDTLQGAEAGEPLAVVVTPEFGLEPPRTGIVLRMQDGTQNEIGIGVNSPVGRQTYILLDGDLRTTRFPLDLQRTATRDELRAREVVRFSRSAIEELRLRTPETRIQAHLEDGDWWLTSPEGKHRANPETISQAISTLLDLRVDDFGGQPLDEEPAIDLEILTRTGRSHLRAWQGQDDGWTAQSGLHDGTLIITPGLAAIAILSEATFFLKKLLPIRKATLTSIEIALAGIELDSTLVGDTWSDPRTSALLAALDTLEVDRSEPPSVPLQVAGQIVLKEGDQRTMQLDFYQTATGYLAQEKGGGLGFPVSDGYIQDLLNVLTPE